MSAYPFPLHDVAAAEAASECDRAWFKAHPGRAHRIRRALFGEVPLHPDLLCFVAVRQVAPGVRVRAGFRRPPPAPPHEPTEVEAAAIFGCVMNAQPDGWNLVSAMEHIAREAKP